MPMTWKTDRFPLVVLIVLVLASWAPRLRGPIDLRWDAGVYYVLGTSMSEGKGYRLLNEPGEIPAVIFPPLLPAIVFAHQRILGSTDPVLVGRALRFFFLTLFLVYVLAAYRLIRSLLDPFAAFLGTFLTTLTYLPIWLSDRCYSDLPFALAAVLFATASGARGPARELASWMVATSGFMLRTIGGVFFGAWILEHLVARAYKKAALAVVFAALPVIMWLAYVHGVTTGPSYTSTAYTYQRADYNIYNVTYGQLFTFRDHLRPALGTATPVERVKRLPSLLPAFLVGLGGAVAVPMAEWEYALERIKRLPLLRLIPWRSKDLVLTTLGLLVPIGMALQLRDRQWRIPFIVLGYLGGLCAMPPSYLGELPRYLAVIAPLIFMTTTRAMLACLNVRRHIGRYPVWAMNAGATLAIGFIVTLGGLSVLRGYVADFYQVEHRDWNGHRVQYRLFSYLDDYAQLDAALEWLKTAASRNEVVASTVPQWVYLRTGLKTVMPPFEENASKAQALLDDVPVKYFIVSDWLSRRYAAPVHGQASEEWRLVYSTETCAIYQRQGR